MAVGDGAHATNSIGSEISQEPVELEAELSKLGLRRVDHDRTRRRETLLSLAHDVSQAEHNIELLIWFMRGTTRGHDLFWARETLWRIANDERVILQDSSLRYRAISAARQVFDHIKGREETALEVQSHMVPLESAICVVGSPSDEVGRSSNEQQRSVKLDAFSISSVQIAAYLYNRFDPTHSKSLDDTAGLRPAVEVCWYDAYMFAEWVGAELPTSAEWEFACRAGSEGRYCFGNDERILERFAWFDRNSQKHAQPVRTKEPNVWGIFDMHGNVWEWCQDFGMANPVDRISNRLSNAPRQIRGGSFCCPPAGVRSAQCGESYPDATSDDVGFRLVYRRLSQAALVLINNSCSKSPSSALMEWSIQKMGYSTAATVCHICGQRITYFVHWKNHLNDANLIIGRDCHLNLLKEQWARESDIPNLSENKYTTNYEKRVEERVMHHLRQVSNWPLQDIDYSSWKQWFLEQSREGLLPESLQKGITHLKAGLPLDEDLTNQFIEHHNAVRRFPGHILIPHARIRALFHEPAKIPVSLSIDEAVRFSMRDKPRAALGLYVVDRLQSQYECEGRPLEYALALTYNYILCIARGYEGAEGKNALWRYLYTEPLLRRNPAFDGMTSDKAIKAVLDLEIQGTLRTIASLVSSAFAQARCDGVYERTLLARLEQISRTGYPAPVWPLASFPAPNQANPAKKHRVDSVRSMYPKKPVRELGVDSVRSMFSRSGITAEGSSALTDEARYTWTELTTAPQDILIVAGWIDVAHHRSCVAVMMNRHRSVVSIGLNRCWSKASASIRQAIFSVIIRDLEGACQDENLLRVSRAFLCATVFPKEAEDSKLRDVLRHQFDFDLDAWAQKEPAPRLVDDKVGDVIRYERWSHTLYVPTGKTSSSRRPRSGQPSRSVALTRLSTLEPLVGTPPRGSGSNSKRRKEAQVYVPDEGWYCTKWAWVQPEENALDATFTRRFILPHVDYGPEIYRREYSTSRKEEHDDGET